MTEIFIVLRHSGIYQEGFITDVYDNFEFARMKIAEHIIEWCKDGTSKHARAYKNCSDKEGSDFDGTEQSECLLRCLANTVEVDTPVEAKFYDGNDLIYAEKVVSKILKTHAPNLNRWF